MGYDPQAELILSRFATGSRALHKTKTASFMMPKLWLAVAFMSLGAWLLVNFLVP